MDSLVEKFDIFDFFNLIIAGAVFETGMGFCDPFILDHLNEIKKWVNSSTLEIIFVVFMFLILSYLAGTVFFALGRVFLWPRVHQKMVKECLYDSSPVKNEEKLKHYKSNASDFFAEKGTPVADKEHFTEDQNECYFAHCIYYIQIRSQNKKTEKLRNVAGLSLLLTVCFSILGVFSLLVIIYLWINLIKVSLRQLITCVVYFLIVLLFYHKYKEDEAHHIIMVLAVYDVCKDMDDKESNQLEVILKQYTTQNQM